MFQAIEPISALVNLEKLYLNNNAFKEIDALSGLVNLQDLSLLNNEINEIEALSGLDNLQELNLSLNAVENIEPISKLQSLAYLFLVDNNIDSSIQSLVSLKAATLINIKGNKKVLCEDILVLQSALGDIIEFDGDC